MNTSHRTTDRLRHRLGRTVRGALLVAVIGAAAGCGSTADVEQPSRAVGAVEASRGSDRHLELKAAELADRFDASRRSAVGSDRHLELKAAEIANRVEANARAARGSDRHLELRAAEIADRVDSLASE